GRLIGKVDPRYLIAFGFTVLSAAMLHMVHTLQPGIDFHTAMMMRIYQSCGLAFLFVPINTLVYAGIPPNKSNQVSGIVNLSRNMGGDIGIALVTTLIARRSQAHQANLVAHTDSSNPALLARLHGLIQALEHAGTSSVDATRKAYGAIYRQLLQQAQTLAYLDVLLVFAVFTGLMVPLVLLTKKARAGAAPTGH
ncbi:MAG TPA: hypothetical protein VMR96_07575, partial [Solirubrobacterales bacterium]|nr:hypothetical protein [Solirubrobacterales bacterium]